MELTSTNTSLEELVFVPLQLKKPPKNKNTSLSLSPSPLLPSPIPFPLLSDREQRGRSGMKSESKAKEKASALIPALSWMPVSRTYSVSILILDFILATNSLCSRTLKSIFIVCGLVLVLSSSLWNRHHVLQHSGSFRASFCIVVSVQDRVLLCIQSSMGCSSWSGGVRVGFWSVLEPLTIQVAVRTIY